MPTSETLDLNKVKSTEAQSSGKKILGEKVIMSLSPGHSDVFYACLTWLK